MKKYTLVLIAFLMISSVGFSQTEKGNFMTFGATNLALSWASGTIENKGMADLDEDKNFELGLMPAAGYFIIDNLAIGLGIQYQYSSVKREYQTTGGKEYYYPEKNYHLVFAPFARYYFGHKHIRPFIQGDFDFGTGKTTMESLPMNGFNTKADVVTTDLNHTVIGYGITPGVAFFINEKFSVDLGVYYRHIQQNFDNSLDTKRKTNRFGASFGFSLFF